VFEQSGFQALSSSTSFIASLHKDEFGSNATIPLAYSAFRTAYGIQESQNITSFYRKLSWGTAVDVFVMDLKTEVTSTQLISTTQMDWITNGLQDSTATFKVIVSSSPISDLSSLPITPPDGWDMYPEQRDQILEFIDNNNIGGVIWISGGIGFSILRTGHETTKSNSTSNQFEVVVGPTGSKVNPNIQLTSLLGLAGSNFNAIIDTWTYTLFDADPVAGTITISFNDDYGNEIQSFSLNINESNFGL